MFWGKQIPSLYNALILTQTGNFEKISLLSHNKQEALTTLLKDGNTPLRLTKAFFKPKKIAHSQLLIFLEALLFLLENNLSLLTSLELLFEKENHPVLAQLLKQLIELMKKGFLFSNALNQFPAYFSNTLIAFIKNGEETGALTDTLKKFCAQLQSAESFKATLKKSLSYPLFLLTSTLMIGLGLLLFVLPQYQTFFDEMGTALPPLTQNLLNLSQWLSRWGFPSLLLTVGALATLKFLLKHPKVKLNWHFVLLKLPGLRNLILSKLLAQWCGLMAHALNSELPLLTACQLANTTLNNLHVRNTLKTLNQSLKKGESLLTSLSKTGFFNPTSLKLLRIAESTGTLGLVFSKIAKDYRATLDKQLHKLIKATEPTCLLLLAGLAGLLFAALYLPLLTLGLTK